MKQNNLNLTNVLTRFFTANNCEIKQEQEAELKIQLTKEMDLALMNRPFYWQYIEATGNIGQPMELTFSLDNINQNSEGEWIHFGSPRLEKIFQYLKHHAKFIRLYETVQVDENTVMHPWLLLNVLIKYVGKQKKEELLSLGLNLINGSLQINMMEKLMELSLLPTISNNCYTISPIIKVSSGINRIENYLYEYIQKKNHQWAVDSVNLLTEEIEMIKHFYADNNEETMHKEVKAVTNRLQPRINFNILNGGLVYLTPK